MQRQASSLARRYRCPLARAGRHRLHTTTTAAGGASCKRNIVPDLDDGPGACSPDPHVIAATKPDLFLSLLHATKLDLILRRPLRSSLRFYSSSANKLGTGLINLLNRLNPATASTSPRASKDSVRHFRDSPIKLHHAQLPKTPTDH